MPILSLLVGLTGLAMVSALVYTPEYVRYNLNTAKGATSPLDYNGTWENHQFNPSPRSWRFPFYTLFLDRYVNGDPSNDNINGTVFEQDVMSNQLRHGGDLQGLIDSLDYIQGIGIKAIYIAGSPYINQPWGADSYSPLDFTLLDAHFGDIELWRKTVTAIHDRGMYVILDQTMATMGDLIGFDGHLNSSTPFTTGEYKVSWKSDRRYTDFSFGNTYNDTCEYPRFWLETGFLVGQDVLDSFHGCYDSDFDQYGDTEAFGSFPAWQRQLSKFASVQDRLREWRPSVRSRIQHFSCIIVQMLDVDGMRLDKATQLTVDALGEWSDYMRQCAQRLGKNNFFIAGEIAGGNTFGSIYIGRGREPTQKPKDMTEAINLNKFSPDTFYIRQKGKNTVDAAAFHSTVYRALTRFLGMDGLLEVSNDAPVNWVDMWNTFLVTNDFVNPSTGQFDPRHMYGTTNQDVFRWPALKNGTQKMLLGMFITTLHMPGIPLLLWGEEQKFYLLDNTADNYLFGRQPMSPSLAWQTHGCYKLGSSKYFNFSIGDGAHGCEDDWNSLDHRDPSSPERNIIKHMFQMRTNYPVLNDGAFLQALSNQTRDEVYKGSNGISTETGIWSTVRAGYPNVQDLGGGNQTIWLVYTNENQSKTFNFDCNSTTNALISAFPEETTVRNLFFPHDEYKLSKSPVQLGIAGAKDFNGCLDRLQMPAWGFKAFVPKDKFQPPGPMITKFLPGHDARLTSKVARGQQESVQFELHFNVVMDCDQISKQMKITSTTENKTTAQLDRNSVNCSVLSKADLGQYVGGLASAFSYKANLVGVSNGVHTITINNVTADGGSTFTNTVDHFFFRIGQPDNPIVFPRLANYTTGLLSKNNSDGSFVITHKAAGADQFRYSLDWQTSWSNWLPYQGGQTNAPPLNWSGTHLQAWDGDHVLVQYYSRMVGSGAHVQHADINQKNPKPRRFAHLWAYGPFNKYGSDAGLPNQLVQDDESLWKWHFFHEWPSRFQLSGWGINPDGKPDQTLIFGDVDNDTVLDRMPPSNLGHNAIFIGDQAPLELRPSAITPTPPSPYLAYVISLNDATFKFEMIPVGNRWYQMALYFLLWVVPVATGTLGTWAFMKIFYQVKFNQVGVTEKRNFNPQELRRRFKRRGCDADNGAGGGLMKLGNKSGAAINASKDALGAAASSTNRRTVLIATMEYNIEDWAIKIKIGGLGVMAELMGKTLGHLDLIWVVPCVGGIDYPWTEAEQGDNMVVTVLGRPFHVEVHYHVLRNITYVLLDAPVFRQQTKNEPYPPGKQDLQDSAIYYSAWNQCIAQAIKRFPIDLYHINDYHGALAPVYLLPEVIPACLSLHNAEFQGLWPMRTPKAREEVCQVYNLDPEICQKYVQFGDIFNLLHAGASYLRIHQKGFGAVGVSKKYGKRSFVRYPIFWGLNKIGKLPNPDPTDTAEWSGTVTKDNITVDANFEAGRAELKRQAQEWAGLDQTPNAELLAFVGRWSKQKGIDLIADIMPAILEENQKVQLICVGPVIDLYGKFAALKLNVMMEKYPGRVFSKPEFSTLPSYIWSGAEFALIPSRDEPFGLVAVEFGRKGALGIGARVGGLGQMPGWWFTVESTTTTHMLHQFRLACREALRSSRETRAMMRARSAKQRFPVAQWVEDLEKLQTTAIKSSSREFEKAPATTMSTFYATTTDTRPSSPKGWRTPNSHTRTNSGYYTPGSIQSGEPIRTSSPARIGLTAKGSPKLTLSLGIRAGLGQVQPAHMGSKTKPVGVAIPNINEKDDHTPGSPANLVAFDPSLVPPSAGFLNADKPLSSRLLSLKSVIGDKTDLTLQNGDPIFTDADGKFYRAFEHNLQSLDSRSSENQLCIEDFLLKSEKKWFGDFQAAKLGKPRVQMATHKYEPRNKKDGSIYEYLSNIPAADSNKTFKEGVPHDQFLLGENYRPPTGVRRLMMQRIGDWPVYSLFLGFGQIIAANSYQITLLTGEVGESALKLYVITTIYLFASIGWWTVFRMMKSLYSLSVPFLFYGLGFLAIGIAPFVPGEEGRGWIQNVGTGLYCVASASGSIFFALNFGDEGASPVKVWVHRACVIQGTQQIYVVALWYWRSRLTQLYSTGTGNSLIITTVTAPITILMWLCGILLFLGLPMQYRQAPGRIPSFYQSLFRRKLIGWFFVTILIQNYWLSAAYGRNWSYLFSSQWAPIWAIFILVAIFFIGVWAGFLSIFSWLSKDHSWILPIFAIGLGAPRWCQMLWGISGIGNYVPWMGNPIASALAARSLWLWLGVLDAIQGVGFGMILLQTLTRMHICFTLLAAQGLGSFATILGRATAPNNIAPGPVFPDFSAGYAAGLANVWFWIALIMQLTICAGFFTFFRKEQLSKP